MNKSSKAALTTVPQIRSQAAGSTARLDFLPSVEQFVPSQANAPFGMGDLYRASGLTASDFVMLASGGTNASVEVDRLDTSYSEEPDAVTLLAQHELWNAVAAISAILKEVFGERAFVNVALDDEAQDSDPALVAEAHLSYESDDAERLIALQDEFLVRYVQAVAPQERSLLRLAIFADSH